MADAVLSALETAPQRARVAFAALCARRVQPIFTLTCQAVKVPNGPQTAIATALAFVTGASIDPLQLAQAKAALEAAYPLADEGGGPDHFACAASGYALDAMEDVSPRSAWLASCRALDAIDQIDEEEGSAEEQDWQLQLLARLASIGADALTAEMLVGLDGPEPDWRKRLTV